jgi:Fur family ferric uptake transcriptional regulator
LLFFEAMSASAQDAYQAAEAALKAYIRSRGLRETRERYAILKEIYLHLDHFDAEQLYTQLLGRGIKVSRATVYNALQLFVEAGLVRRYLFGEGRMLYERSLGRQQHDHLICLDCGEIEEFCDPQLGLVSESVGRLFGMRPKRHDLVIYASCERPNCSHRKKIPTFDRK